MYSSHSRPLPFLLLYYLRGCRTTANNQNPIPTEPSFLGKIYRKMPLPSIPLYYKALGSIKKATTLNPLMDNVRILYDIISDGKSIDLFAFNCVDAQICNSFDPILDWPKPREPEKHGDKIIYHNPVLVDKKDHRNILRVLGDKKTNLVLLDPPFTYKEQKKLYGGTKSAKELLIDSPESIKKLYEISCKYAFKVSKRAVVVYGYKMPTTPPSWDIAACWAVGGGSHPAMCAFMYLHNSYHSDELMSLIKEHALTKKAVITELFVITKPKKSWPPPYFLPSAKNKGKEFSLAGKADIYKQIKLDGDTKSHPTYLSKSMDMMCKQFPNKKSLVVHSPFLSLYKKTKLGPCFQREIYSISVYKLGNYEDIVFIIKI